MRHLTPQIGELGQLQSNVLHIKHHLTPRQDIRIRLKLNQACPTINTLSVSVTVLLETPLASLILHYERVRVECDGLVHLASCAPLVQKS